MPTTACVIVRDAIPGNRLTTFPTRTAAVAPCAVIAESVVASTAGSITVKTGAHTSNALGSGEYAIATPAGYSHTTT